MADFTGTSGADSIAGTVDDDVFHLEQGGHDTADGGAGDDVFYLGAGFDNDDRIDGRSGYDRLILDGDYSAGVNFNNHSLRGIDEIDLATGNSYLLNRLERTSGGLVINGSQLGPTDTMYILAGYRTDGVTVIGGAGADTIDGARGTDQLFGGAGDDQLSGSDAASTVKGGEGNDEIQNGDGGFTRGDGGDDFIEVGGASETALGGAGQDTIIASSGFPGIEAGVLDGGAGDDFIVIEPGTADWHCIGGAGADFLLVEGALFVESGDSLLEAGKGNDTLQGGGGHDTLDGGRGKDLFHGGYGAELALGGSGADTFTPASGDDTFDGGTGTDTLDCTGDPKSVRVDLGVASVTGSGLGRISFSSIENVVGSVRDDVLIGDSGENMLVGLSGSDTLNGGDGGDHLLGGAKADILTGGQGADILDGGSGADTFLFGQLSDSALNAPDFIVKLQPHDTIDLSAIDADTTIARDQAFRLVESFDGHAGELVLVYDPTARLTSLEVDVDGDQISDMTVQIKGDHAGFVGFVL